MAADKTIVQDALIRDQREISASLKIAETQSALRLKMISARLDSQFDAIESLLTANHEEIMRALKTSDKSSA